MFKINLLIILINLIQLFELNTCMKLDRLIRDLSQNNQNINQIDNLQINKQNQLMPLTPFDLNENIEENTKNVIYWTPDNYPNPFIDYKNCSLKEKGYICDPDDILEEEDIYKLRQSIEGLNEDLDNYCTNVNGKQGIDFGIAIMNQFKEIENKTLRETAKEYAEKLRKKWQLGGQCDNGLLILQSSKDSILTYSMGRTTVKLIKNVTINALNLNLVDNISVNENNNQPLGQIQDALLQISTGLSFVNKDKALSRINSIANSNPKVGNALKNVGATLERHIEKEEARARLSELNSNDKSYIGINGELLLIYFLLFVLTLTISCFVLGVFLKRRLGNSNQNRNNSNSNNLHNGNTNDKTAIQDKTRYIKVPTNNNDLTNLNLNN